MLQTQLDEFWNTILAEVENFLSPGAIERWLKPLKPVSFADNTFTLSSDNEVIIQFFEKRYRDFTQDACKEACRKLEFTQDIQGEIIFVLEYRPAEKPAEKPKTKTIEVHEDNPQGSLDFGRTEESAARYESSFATARAAAWAMRLKPPVTKLSKTYLGFKDEASPGAILAKEDSYLAALSSVLPKSRLPCGLSSCPSIVFVFGFSAGFSAGLYSRTKIISP